MPENLVQLTYIGGPTAVIEFGEVRLITDPTFDAPGGEYTTGPVTLRKHSGPALTPEQVGAVDYVLLSHDHHFDNLDHTGREFLKEAGRVVTTAEGAERLGGRTFGLRDWESVDLPAGNRILRVVATPAQHGPAGLNRGAVVGFVFYLADAPESSVYFSGDTVWYDGVKDVASRFPVKAALLNLGAARVPAVGPFHLTMTALGGVEAARAFPDAAIVPLHFEGWEHFSEGRAEIARAFAEAGLTDRLHWPEPGRRIAIAA